MAKLVFALNQSLDGYVSLTAAGLIDEYQLYVRPIARGSGKPLFAGPLPRLRLLAGDLLGEDVIRLTYAPA